jgi:hypothetical protein
MNQRLVLEEINRVGYLMNYNIENSSNEQVSLTINEERVFNNIVSEGPTQVQQKPAPKQGQQQQKLTPEQIATAKAKIQQQADKQAYAIFGELMKAFDIDGDKDLKDNDGTNEKAAVAAIQKIKNKETLDSLNRYIGKWKQYPNLKTWLNAEMSDFDGEYGQIWAKLEKMGYAGANYSVLAKVAGVAADVTGVRAAMDVGEGLVQLFKDPVAGFKQIIDSIRGFLGGTVGGVITTILDFTGIGKVVTSIGWGLLLAGDVIISVLENAIRWPEIILGFITIATTGAIGATVGKVLKPFMGKGGALGSLIQKLSTFSWFKNLSSWISNGISKITGLVKSAITWLVSQGWWKKYMVNSTVGKLISSAMGKINEYLTSFTQSLAKVSGAGSKYSTSAVGQQLKQKAIAKGGKDIKKKITTDLAKDLGNEATRTAVGAVGGEKAQKTMDLVKAGKSLKSDFGDLAKSNKKVGSTGFSTVSPTTAKIAKQTGSVAKDVVKLSQKTAKVAGSGEENKTQQPKQVQPKKQPVPMAEDVLEEIREINRYMRVIL